MDVREIQFAEILKKRFNGKKSNSHGSLLKFTNAGDSVFDVLDRNAPPDVRGGRVGCESCRSQLP
jgi:hypothetical protein